jgi:hypothetical protein
MALTFLVASLVHLGLRVPIGFATLTEPRTIPAAVVKGSCGFTLMSAAWSVFSRQSGSRLVTVVALLVALAGVALGMFVLSLGRGPITEAHFVYHRVMAVALVADLVLLRSPSIRRQLGKPQRQ